MKVQYFGDVNDYRKFALLRLLATVGGFKIGVCWLLTPDEGSKREYLGRPDQWRTFDPALFDLLKNVTRERPATGLEHIEKSNVVPDALFFNELTPGGKDARRAHHERCMRAFAGTDLVFFDPDNGLMADSVPNGRSKSRKHVYLNEVADHYAARQSVLLYQHYPREPREAFLTRMAGKLSSNLSEATIWSFQTAHAAFMLTARSEHVARDETMVRALPTTWSPGFLKVERHATN